MEGCYSGPDQIQPLTPLAWIPLVRPPAVAPRMHRGIVTDLQHLLDRKSSFPPLHPLLPSLPAACTSGSAFPKHIRHRCLRGTRNIWRSSGSRAGGSGAAGHSPGPARHSQGRTAPAGAAGLGPSPCPALPGPALPGRGAPDLCATHGSQRFSPRVLQGRGALRQL